MGARGVEDDNIIFYRLLPPNRTGQRLRFLGNAPRVRTPAASYNSSTLDRNEQDRKPYAAT